MDGDKSEHLLEAIPVMGCYCDIIGVRSFAGLTDRDYDYAETVINQFIKYSGKPVFAMESANACASGMGSLKMKTREWLFFRFTFSLTDDSLEQPKRAIMALRPRVKNKKWGTRIAHPQLKSRYFLHFKSIFFHPTSRSRIVIDKTKIINS